MSAKWQKRKPCDSCFSIQTLLQSHNKHVHEKMQMKSVQFHIFDKIMRRKTIRGCSAEIKDVMLLLQEKTVLSCHMLQRKKTIF